MNFIEQLYDRLTNPLDDPNVYRKLVKAYFESKGSLGNLYNAITRTEPKHTTGFISTTDKEDFYVHSFNRWKSHITTMPDDVKKKVIATGRFGTDFEKLKSYLLTLPKFTSLEQIRQVVQNPLVEQYKWNAINDFGYWNHIKSQYISGYYEGRIKVEHRLYLNTQSTDTYKMVSLFQEKCEQKRLPYYFKFDEYGNRDDTLVIYSSTDLLPHYLVILREIKKENPELVSRCQKPPILTGKIDNWIGYGPEPSLDKDGNPRSFNSVREKALDKAFDRPIFNWIYQNRNTQVSAGTKVYSLSDYIAYQTIATHIKDMKEYNENSKKRGINDNLQKRYGLTEQDLVNPKFVEFYFSKIRAKIYDFCSTGKIENFDISTKNGNQIRFTDRNIYNALGEMTPIFFDCFKDFAPGLKDSIKQSLNNGGIDPNKICFDKETLQKSKTALVNTPAPVRKSVASPTPRPVKPQVIAPAPKPQVMKSATNINMSGMMQINYLGKNISIYPNKVIDYINPAVRIRPVTLPSGKKTTFDKFLLENVIHTLPKTGTVTLKNGATIGVLQYIEEELLSIYADKQINPNIRRR